MRDYDDVRFVYVFAVFGMTADLIVRIPRFLLRRTVIVHLYPPNRPLRRLAVNSNIDTRRKMVRLRPGFQRDLALTLNS